MLYCSFCGKAQHEVNKLVAGPAVFNTKQRTSPPDDVAEVLTWVARNTAPVSALAGPVTARRMLDHATGTVDDDILTSSAIIHLKNKAIDELLVMQKFSQDQLKRYEQALRTATPVLNERKQ